MVQDGKQPLGRQRPVTVVRRGEDGREVVRRLGGLEDEQVAVGEVLLGLVELSEDGHGGGWVNIRSAPKR